VKTAILLLIVTVAGVCFGGSPTASSAMPQDSARTAEQDQEMQDRMQRAANKQRQEEIKKDTEKLYQLASELKDAVGKSNENMLSLQVIKKAEEVEKLAKRVKEKMREGAGKPLKTETPPVVIPKPNM
jgi:predicted methyltransferase